MLGRARAALLIAPMAAASMVVPFLAPNAVAALPAGGGGEVAVGDVVRALTADGSFRDARGAAGVDGTVRGVVYNGTTKRTVRLTPSAGELTPTPAQRVSRVDVTLDYRSRRVTVAAPYAANPTASQESAVYAFLGEMSGGECNAAIAVAGTGHGGSTHGAFIDAKGNETKTIGVSRSRSGSTLTLRTSAHASLAAPDWDCAYAAVATPGSEPKIYTVFSARWMDDHYVPALSIGAGDPMQGNYGNKWTTVRVEVGNSGRVEARNVRVKATGKGLRFKKKRTVKVGTLRSGGTDWRIQYKVKRKGKKKIRPMRLTVSANGAKSASTKVRIAQKPRPTKPRSLARSYFWSYSHNRLDTGWANEGVMFVDQRWAYRGFPKRGVPKCSAKVKECKRYTYNPRNGKVKIGKVRGTVDSEKLRLGKGKKAKTFHSLALPKKGARLKVNLKHQNFSGCTFGMGFCRTWTETLVMNKKGRFVRTSSSLSSFGVPGVGDSYFSRFSPDERGTYRVLPKGRIRFQYANGKKKTHTIGVERNTRGRPSPGGVGLLLGSTNFYRP